MQKKPNTQPDTQAETKTQTRSGLQGQTETRGTWTGQNLGGKVIGTVSTTHQKTKNQTPETKLGHKKNGSQIQTRKNLSLKTCKKHN